MATVPETVPPLTPPTDKPDALYEFVDGEWKETPRMGALATRLAFFLGRRLDEFAEKQHDNRQAAHCQEIFDEDTGADGNGDEEAEHRRQHRERAA